MSRIVTVIGGDARLCAGTKYVHSKWPTKDVGWLAKIPSLGESWVLGSLYPTIQSQLHLNYFMIMIILIAWVSQVNCILIFAPSSVAQVRGSIGGSKIKFPLVECGQSCLTLCDPMDRCLPGSSVYGIFPGKDTGGVSHFLFQGIFLTQGLNPHLLQLLHCRQILYPLRHVGSPMFPLLVYNL